jgi:hypothetical protein
MLDELKCETVWMREFEPDEPIFKSIFRTTWPDMEEQGLVKSHHTLGGLSLRTDWVWLVSRYGAALA